MQLSAISLGMARAGGAPNLDPRVLFAAGEQGFWYDPSDFSTLYQDSAGTTPVTALSQPVGRILDKSGRGNHATQSTALSRPTVEARVNLFTKSEFPGGVTDSPIRGGLVSSASLPNWLGRFTTGVAFGHDGIIPSYVYQYGAVASTPLVISAYVKMDDGNAPVFGSVIANHSANDFVLVITGYVVADPTTYSVVSVGDGVYRVSANVTSGTISLGNNGVAKYGINSNRTFKVTGCSLEYGTSATTYQRVNTATDYVDVGAARYALLDKSDDHFTVAAGGAGTTGILLAIGVMVPAAGTARTIWSDRGTNTGYRLSIDATNKVTFSGGTGAAFTTLTSAGALTAGTKYILMAWHDGTNLNLSINGVSETPVALGTVTAGTTTFTVGKDNGSATGYWGDRLYQMVYRKNDTSNASQRAQLFQYIRAKMQGL